MAEQAYTFSNGSEAQWWKDRNCDGCAKGYDNDKMSKTEYEKRLSDLFEWSMS